MRGGSLRCFKVYVPNEQGGGGLMRWQTPSPYAPPPFIGSWGDPQIGAGVKDMAKDFVKGQLLNRWPYMRKNTRALQSVKTASCGNYAIIYLMCKARRKGMDEFFPCFQKRIM